MRCQDVKIQLQALSIGELPVDVRQAVQVHISDCAACRADLAKIDALACMGAAAQSPPIPEGFSARVLTMARQRQGNDLFEMMRRRSHCTGQSPGMMPLGSGRREGGKTGMVE